MTTSPYRQPIMTLERHEQIVADVRLQMQAAQRKLDAEAESDLRRQGAKDLLHSAFRFLQDNGCRCRIPETEIKYAARFLIWLMWAVDASTDGKTFDIDAAIRSACQDTLADVAKARKTQ